MEWQRTLGLDLQVPDDFGYWFAGLVDGEGYLSISLDSRHNGACCALRIKLRDDDTDILENIQATLGIGRLFHYPNPSNKQSNPQIEYRVGRIGDVIHVLLPLFERYPLRTKKQRDFVIWARAARLIHGKHHHTDNGREELMRLKLEIEQVRHYKPSYSTGDV